MRLRLGGIAFACAGLVATPWAGAQPAVAGLHEVLLLHANGSADIRATIEWPAGVRQLALPIAGEAPTSINARARSGAAVTVRWSPDRRQLDLALESPATEPWQLEVGYSQENVAARNASGGLSLSRQFMNTTDAPIERYAMTLVLPDHFVFRDVASRDADDRSGTGALGAYEGRHALTIESRLAARGGRVIVDVAADTRTSPRPLMLALAALGAAYLYGFRDLVRRREP